jgi:hypothetical protein
MQRHFSNRGEPRAEVTAAKMLASRKPSTQPQSIARIGRQPKPEQWFTKPTEINLSSKRKQPKRHDDMSPLP